MQLDSRRFPSAAAYLTSLPNGPESFPECMVKEDVFHDARDMIRDQVDLAALPAPLAAYIEGQRQGEWIPDWWGTLLNNMVRDSRFDSDATARAWAYDVSAQVFRRPLYRILMLVMSPTLVVMGATKRWGTFRCGTTLTAESTTEGDQRRAVRVHLDHPASLYSAFMLQTLCASFQAAVDAAGAKQSEVEVLDAAAKRTLFEISWSG